MKRICILFLGMVSCQLLFAADPLPVFVDPTRPADFAEPPRKSLVSEPKKPVVIQRKPLKLSQTIISDTRKLAYINGIAFREGQRVRGMAIVDINKNSVTMRKGNEETVLFITEPAQIKEYKR